VPPPPPSPPEPPADPPLPPFPPGLGPRPPPPAPLPPYPPDKAPLPPPPHPPGKAPNPPPPHPPVVDPTLPQKTKSETNNWLLALGAIVGVWLLFCLGAFCCFRRPFIAAAPVDCEREPDPRNVQEYARWKRECEERTRPTGTKSKLSLVFSDADITKYHAVAT